MTRSRFCTYGLYGFAASVLLASAWAGEIDAETRMVAVMVGVGDAAPGLSASSTNDAAKMARLARSRDFDEVILLNGDEATATNLLATFAEVRTRLQPADMLTFFYFGHAVRVHQPGGDDRGYLLFHGCPAARAVHEGMSMDTLLVEMSSMPSRNLTLLVDACHSGLLMNAVERILADPVAGPQLGRHVIAVVASAGESELAFEADGHGVFTDHLLDALATREDDRVMGRKPAAALLDDLRQAVRIATGGWQEPRAAQYGGESAPIFLRGF